MDKPEQIEAVARAIYRVSYMVCCTEPPRPGDESWRSYLPEAKAAIEAMTPSITGEDEELIGLRAEIERLTEMLHERAICEKCGGFHFGSPGDCSGPPRPSVPHPHAGRMQG